MADVLCNCCLPRIVSLEWTQCNLMNEGCTSRAQLYQHPFTADLTVLERVGIRPNQHLQAFKNRAAQSGQIQAAQFVCRAESRIVHLDAGLEQRVGVIHVLKHGLASCGFAGFARTGCYRTRSRAERTRTEPSALFAVPHALVRRQDPVPRPLPIGTATPLAQSSLVRNRRQGLQRCAGSGCRHRC